MREILFRGKRISDGKWVYGDIFHNHDGRVFIGELIVDDNITKEYDDIYTLGIGFCEVLPDTIGQYTGLVDKNGEQIFEGDILDSPRWAVSYSGDLQAGLGMNAGWYIQRDEFESWSELDCEKYHVILGNIHDNSELLERK